MKRIDMIDRAEKHYWDIYQYELNSFEMFEPGPNVHPQNRDE